MHNYSLFYISSNAAIFSLYTIQWLIIILSPNRTQTFSQIQYIDPICIFLDLNQLGNNFNNMDNINLYAKRMLLNESWSVTASLRYDVRCFRSFTKSISGMLLVCLGSLWPPVICYPTSCSITMAAESFSHWMTEI